MNEIKDCPFCGSEAMVTKQTKFLPNGQRDVMYIVSCTLRECGNSTMPWFPEQEEK